MIIENSMTVGAVASALLAGVLLLGAYVIWTGISDDDLKRQVVTHLFTYPIKSCAGVEMESVTSEGQMGGGGAPAAAGGAFTRQDSFAESCDAGIPARAVP